MTRMAAYAVLILAAILFISIAPSWQVRLRVRGPAVAALAEQLATPDARSPGSPAPLLRGRDIYAAACAGCHGLGRTEFGTGEVDNRPLEAHSPRDIHLLITWGGPRSLPGDLPYSGQAMHLGKSHPAFPAALTDSERWAVAVFVYSGSLDPGSELGNRAWLEAWEERGAGDGIHGWASETYARLCATCHGTLGYGNGPLAGDLTPPPGNLRDTAWLASQSDRYLFRVVEAGTLGPSEDAAWTGMPGWGELLNEQEIRRLVDYMRGWGYSFETPSSRPGAAVVEPSPAIRPDSNQWSWREIRSALPDSPVEPPEWLGGESL